MLYHPSIWEAETGRSWVKGQPGIHSNTMSTKKIGQKKKQTLGQSWTLQQRDKHRENIHMKDIITHSLEKMLIKPPWDARTHVVEWLKKSWQHQVLPRMQHTWSSYMALMAMHNSAAPENESVINLAISI
jgi:hypothetical protein